MRRVIYELSDGRLWDTEAAAFIPAGSPTPANPTVIPLLSAEGRSGEDYLIKTLEFSGFPLGELALKSVSGVKEELAKLDAEYLTPRTLAGLSVNDQEAIARWEEHERLAAPLRKRIADLENS